ncbi:MAG: hypothetical protein HGB10_10520 [Coriobacteriia bacterium]|nr:hypothetical protein [Coriobacteriia bacterium]
MAIECSQNQSTVATTVVATVGGDGTTYSGAVKLPSSGTWYLRARHADANHYPTSSAGWRQVSALAPLSVLTTPTAPLLASTATAFTSTGTVLPAHSAGATVAIECSLDQSTVATTVVATIGGDGTTYSGAVKLPSSGTWYLRAHHADADHYPTTSAGWRQLAALPPLSTLTTPTAPASTYTTKPFVSTGTALPAHSAGSTVAIECSQDQSTVATTVVATIGGDGTTYSANMLLATAGTWYLRARHADAAHYPTTSAGWRTISVTVPPLASLVTTPTSPVDVNTTAPFVSTGTVLPSHAPGAPVEIQCSRDGSTVTTTVPGTIGGDGTTYSATVHLSAAGVWYIRTRHLDEEHAATDSGWRVINVTQSPHADLVTAPTVPATTIYLTTTFTTTGTLLPAHAPGALVQIQCSQNQSTIATTVAATIGADGTTYATTLRLAPKGTWYLRARHADSDHEETFSDWSSLEVVRPLADALSAPSTPGVVDSGLSFQSTGTLLPAHTPGAVVEIVATLDGSSVVATTAATVGGNGTTYTGNLSLPNVGTWSLHARHDDFDHAETLSTASSVQVRTPQPGLGAPAGRSVTTYMWSLFSTSGTFSPVPAVNTPVVLEISRDKTTTHSTLSGSALAGATSYSVGGIKLPSAGAWYVRARSTDEWSRVSYSPWTTITISTSVSLGAPQPRSTMTRNKTYSVSGTLKPRHTSTYLSVRAYRWSGKSWVYKKSYSVRTTTVGQPVDTTKYTASVKLTQSGSWRLKVRHLTHAGEPTQYSGYSRTIKVK